MIDYAEGRAIVRPSVHSTQLLWRGLRERLIAVLPPSFVHYGRRRRIGNSAVDGKVETRALSSDANPAVLNPPSSPLIPECYRLLQTALLARVLKNVAGDSCGRG